MSFKDCWTYVRSDLYRITGNKSLKLGDLLRNGFFDIGFRFYVLVQAATPSLSV